jgi:hypothetical protein
MALSKRDKKGTIIALVILTLCLTTFPMILGATEVREEYNFKVTEDDWTVTHRQRQNTYHFELGKQVGPINIMYRYADLNKTKENRIKFTAKLFSLGDKDEWGKVKVSGRVEYRHFTVGPNHWRARFITDYERTIYGPVTGWIKWQPRVSFKNGTQVFDARDQLGIKFKHNNLTIAPFYERSSVRHYDIKYYVAGAHITYKL